MALPYGQRPPLETVPQNATVLITDWQAGFDPGLLVQVFASQLLSSSATAGEYADWVVTDRIVEVSAVRRDLLEEIASDTDVAAAFEACAGTLRNPHMTQAGVDLRYVARPNYEQPIRKLAAPKPYESGRLVATAAIPIILGIAIIATTSPGVTYHAEQAYIAQAQHAEAVRSERERNETARLATLDT